MTKFQDKENDHNEQTLQKYEDIPKYSSDIYQNKLIKEFESTLIENDLQK